MDYLWKTLQKISSECNSRYQRALLSRFLRNNVQYGFFVPILQPTISTSNFISSSAYYMVVAMEHNFPPQTSDLYNILSIRKFLGFHGIHVSRGLTGANDEFYAHKQPKTDHLMHHLRRLISYNTSIMKSTPQHAIWFLFLGFYLQMSLADSLCAIVLHQTPNRSSYGISMTFHLIQNILFGHFLGASHLSRHHTT